jgi:hypothetical protein
MVSSDLKVNNELESVQKEAVVDLFKYTDWKHEGKKRNPCQNIPRSGDILPRQRQNYYRQSLKQLVRSWILSGN